MDSDTATTGPPVRADAFERSQHDPLQLENRITKLENRITKLETTLKLIKWVVGVSVPLLAVVVQIVANVAWRLPL